MKFVDCLKSCGSFLVCICVGVVSAFGKGKFVDPHFIIARSVPFHSVAGQKML